MMMNMAWKIGVKSQARRLSGSAPGCGRASAAGWGVGDAAGAPPDAAAAARRAGRDEEDHARSGAAMSRERRAEQRREQCHERERPR